MGRPLDDAELAEIRRLHADGKSLRAIAVEIDRAVGTVQNASRDMGLKFDTRPTEAATKAKQQDNRTRRANLVAALYDLAEDDVAYLRGADGGYSLTEVSSGQAVDYYVERLPAQDRRALLGAISTAAQTATRLEQIDGDGGVESAKSMLGDLAAGLHAIYSAQLSDDATTG